MTPSVVLLAAAFLGVAPAVPGPDAVRAALPPECVGLTLTATPDSWSITAGATLSVAAPGVLANDVSASLLGSVSADQDSPATHGTATLMVDGSLTYAPDAGFVGTDTFRYHVACGALNSASTSVSIAVKPRSTPTPTPRTTPAPTPRPTVPVVGSLPVPSLPLPSPSLPGPSLPVQSTIPPGTPAPTATGTPTRSGPPATSPGASTSDASVSPTVSGGGNSTGGGVGPAATSGESGAGGRGSVGGSPPGGRPLTVPAIEPTASLSLGSLSLGAGVQWLVPVFVLTVPGLLVVAIVLAQLAGGGFFVPVARHVLAGIGVKRRRAAGGTAN